MKLLARTAIALAFAGYSAAAFAQQPVLPSASPCSGPTCNVVIVVPADCGSGITVAPDPLVLGGTGSITVTWTVLTPEWNLEDITINEGKGIPKSGVNDNKSQTATFSKRDGKRYKYDVKLAKDRTTKCKLDPTIVNH